MQSLLAPEVSRALEPGNYVLPETIQADPALRALYEDAFRQQAALARELLAAGLPVEEAGYLALAGQVIDLMLEMNGRELLHSLKLRTCSRAQWEIRALAEEMLAHLQKACPEIFRDFGPSCLVEGRCPEGRLSCGKPRSDNEVNIQMKKPVIGITPYRKSRNRRTVYAGGICQGHRGHRL